MTLRLLVVSIQSVAEMRFIHQHLEFLSLVHLAYSVSSAFLHHFGASLYTCHLFSQFPTSTLLPTLSSILFPRQKAPT